MGTQTLHPAPLGDVAVTLKHIIDRLLIPVQTKGWVGDQYRVAKFTVELIAPTVAKLMAEAVKDANGGK